MVKEIGLRKELNEGRNFGVGFSILKKLSLRNFETYLPFTACKDYLNDLVFIEHTKLSIKKKIHGYNHQNQDIFDNKRFFYLGVKALDYNNNTSWDQFNNLNKEITNNHTHICKLINQLEDNINKFKSRTSLYSIQKDENDITILIFKVPIYWVKNPHLISYYTLFIRYFINVNKIHDLKSYYKKHVPFIKQDKYYSNDIINFFNIKYYDHLTTKYVYNKTVTNLDNIHDNGIRHWLKKNKIK